MKKNVKVLCSLMFLAAVLSVVCTACFSKKENKTAPTVERIRERGKVLIGTTGDYRPLTFREEDGSYWGFEIEVAEKLGEALGVPVEYVPTSWPTLSEDTQAIPQKFDFAIGGITVTEKRKETMLMSEGYLNNGKTILCRAEEAGRFTSLSEIDKSDVVVMVNPGGLNEQFAKSNLKHARIVVFNQNEEIPNQIARYKADIMITEITEAPWYIQNDTRLAAPLMKEPFTRGNIGILMPRGQEDLLAFLDRCIAEMKKDGSLNRLKEKYGLLF